MRQGGYFRSEIAIGGNNAIAETVSITTTKGLKRSGQILVPPDPEAFEYDADGNLSRDGHWKYTWDGENRLIAVTSGVGPKPSVQYAYDYAGRMVKRTESFGGQSKTTLYLYEGFRCIAEFDGSGVLQRTYTWGMDLSGGLSGAGGVGGLLSMKSVASGTYFYSYDGNGNVVGLFGANNGVQVAAYEYGPFGEPLRTSGGAVANENRYRFSTKRTDPVTDLVHYEYRVYDPRNGRWISRDPLSENGGINLYAFVQNSPISSIDPDGLETIGDIISTWAKANPKFEGSVTLPPIPAGIGSVVITVSGSVQTENCCKNGKLAKYLSVDVVLRGGYRVGSGSKPYPGPGTASPVIAGKRESARESRNDRIGGNARNDWIQNPNSPDDLIKRKNAKNQMIKKTGGGLLAKEGRCETCPSGNDFEVSGEVGIEGEIGMKWAVYGSATQPLTRDFDVVNGWHFEGGRRDIGWRASAYAEGYLQGKVEGKLPGALLIETGLPCPK